MPSANPPRETATFGGGCFWCLEAVFERLRGVESVVSGYAGGAVPNPTYRAGLHRRDRPRRGRAGDVRPGRHLVRDLLDVFFATHDPTTLNRQGPDVGTQYRSAVFYAFAGAEGRGRAKGRRR